MTDEYLDSLMLKYIPKINPDKEFEKRLRKVSEEAYWEATKQVLKGFYTRNLYTKIAEGDLTLFSKLKDKHLEMLNQESDRLSTKSPFWLITVNPRHDISLTVLRKVIEKIVKKKSIKQYAYCYEIRKYEEKKYKGLHSHIIVYQDDKPYNFKRGIKNTCKNICDINNPHILNFKNIPNSQVLLQKYDYIKGNKSEAKSKGVAHTIDWRKLNNLSQIYESSPPLPCRTTVKNSGLITNQAVCTGTGNDDMNDE